MNAMLPLPYQDDATSLGSSSPGSDTETARAMIERLRAAGPRSTAQMLEELRRTFPHSPLALRVRALAALSGRSIHMPR
jgi:hypothetical protein